ncbi:MAG: DNA translocase FtsK 4TM domain-containing protein [Gemmataceae bacterium]
MQLRRAWRLDVAGVILLAAGLASALAVFSHDPADLPGAVHPVNATPRNMLGEYGALAAHELLTALGLALHVWFAAWFVLVLVLFVRRDLPVWTVRLFGWLLLVPTVAVAAHRWGTPTPSSPVVGVGGSVGAWVDAWLRERLDHANQLAAIAAAGVVGVALAGQFAWRPLGRLVRLLAVYTARLLVAVIRLLIASARLPGRLPRVRPSFRLRLPAFRLPALRRRRQPAPPPLPVEPVKQIPPPPEPLPPAAKPAVKPVASTGIRLRDEIPIKHHGMSLLPDVPRDPDEPDLEERASLSNGLHSERQALRRLRAAADPPARRRSPDRPGRPRCALRDRANLLEKTFRDFGLSVKVVGINTGPVVTMYEIALETGLRVAKVTTLADDVALNLKVPSVRIVAPLPGKNAVGIEIPNESRADVRLKEVLQASTARTARSKIPLFLGKTPRADRWCATSPTCRTC